MASMFKAAKVSSGRSASAVAADAQHPAAAPEAMVLSNADDHQGNAVSGNMAAAGNEGMCMQTVVHSSTGAASVSDSAGVHAAIHAKADFDRWQDTECQPSAANAHSQLGAKICDAAEDPVGMGDNSRSVAQAFEDTQRLSETLGPANGEQRDGAAAVRSDQLNSVDLAEQKQIMHDLWLERNALAARNLVKRPAPASKTGSKRSKVSSLGKGKQTQLSALLRRVQPP